MHCSEDWKLKEGEDRHILILDGKDKPGQMVAVGENIPLMDLSVPDHFDLSGTTSRVRTPATRKSQSRMIQKQLLALGRTDRL